MDAITIQACIECGRLANVQIVCASWACAECGRVQATVYGAGDFDALVRSVCPVGGKPDEVGVILGGVGFWIDAEGPWAGRLSFSNPMSTWDLKAVQRDLVARLTEVRAC